MTDTTALTKSMEIYESKLIQYRKANGEQLADSSITMYLRNINNYVLKYGLDWKLNKVKENLDSFSTSTKMNYLNSIINYFTVMEYKKSVLTPYLKYRDSLIKKKADEPQIAPSKQKNLVPWDTILEWLKQVKSNTAFWQQTEQAAKYDSRALSDFQTDVLLSLYVNFPRRNEIADLKFYRDTDPFTAVGEDEQAENIIVHYVSASTMSIIFKNYKTGGVYGTQEFKLPEDLYQTILFYVRKYNIVEDYDNDNVMFRGVRNKEPLSRLNLTKLLQRSSKKYIGVALSTNMIRHSFATSKYADIKSELITDADILAHAPATLMNTYVVSEVYKKEEIKDLKFPGYPYDQVSNPYQGIETGNILTPDYISSMTGAELPLSGGLPELKS